MCFNRAGTVHSLRDVVVFEVQENSDVTFRLFDWDHIDPQTHQRRPLQVDQAMACINFTQGSIQPVTPQVLEGDPVHREISFIATTSGFVESAESSRLQRVPRKPARCWCASRARASWSTLAPIIPSIKATCCFCRPSLERVSAARMARSQCWKFRFRRFCNP